MKTHIDNTIPKEWVSDWMVDDGNDKLLWNDKAPTPNQVIKFIEENYVSKAQSKKYADERVREFVEWLMSNPQPIYYDNRGVDIDRLVTRFLNQNTESSNEDKERNKDE